MENSKSCRLPEHILSERMMSGNKTFYLKRPDDPLGTAVSLPEPTTLIGRESGCGIVLADDSVSRQHAQLCVLDSTLRVKDLQSKNGTYVDEERIQVRLVNHGQRIRFGNIAFILTVGQADTIAASPALETKTIEEPHPPPLLDHTSLRLSPAEHRVFTLLLQGMAEKRIAQSLRISRHTVHNHVRHIYAALNVHSRAELLARFVSPHTKPRRSMH
jgi:pSer/pThr/pTyr-binding forkhead associated (FHA) protein